MQELSDDQRQIFFYPQILTLEAQKERLKCPNKIQASFVCINPRCKIPGLMCRNQSCQCMQNHKKCKHIQTDRILASIDSHRKQLPQDFRQSYKITYQIINGIIDQLSRIRRKVQLEEMYFGLTENQLSFIQLVDDQNIQKICGKTVYKMKKKFDTESCFIINYCEEIKNKIKMSIRSQFDSLCKYIQNIYTRIDLNDVNWLLKDSLIVYCEQEKFIMYKWLLEKSNKKQLSSKLLFRASEHNFRAAQFHKRCDGIKNMLVIVKNEFDKVIGGFTPNKFYNSWNGNYIHDEQDKTFLFSLTLKEKYICTDPQNSIYCHRQYGPVFSTDLVLNDRAHEVSNTYSIFPTSYNLYQNGAYKYERNQQSWSVFSGATEDQYFKVKQYQVYQIQGM